MQVRNLLPVIALFILLISVNGCKYPLLLMGIVILHEAAHVITAKILGARIRLKPATASGLVLEYESHLLSPGKEAAIAAMGILANLICAVILLSFCDLNSPEIFFCFCANLSLALINLMPVKCFDGAVILNCILIKFADPSKLFRATKIISDVFALLFSLFTIYYHLQVGFNLSMLILSLYLNIELVSASINK